MIWRSFITFREYVRVRKIYLDNQLPKLSRFYGDTLSDKVSEKSFDKEITCKASLLKLNFIGH